MAGKLPAFQFYPGDWMRDPQLRRCSLAAKGLWIELLCLMHQMPTRGVLRDENGAAWLKEDVIAAVNGATEELLDQLLRAGVLKQAARTGLFYCRRMVLDYLAYRRKARSGKEGGRKSKATGKQTGSKSKANHKAKQGSSTSSSVSTSSSESVCVSHARDEAPPTDSERLERPPDGPIAWGTEEALFLDLWNSCPEGLRGVVRVRGTPPLMSPKDRTVFREEWPARRDVAMQALTAICGGAIEWDRQPLTICAFFNEIDSIIGGGHAKRTRSTRDTDRPETRVDGSAEANAIERNQQSAAEFLASLEPAACVSDGS